MKPIRILHVFGRLDLGGAETLIMNVYRHIDRTKVQFDFVVHTNDACVFDDEIRSMGGTIYNCPRYNIVNHFTYVKWWNDFFSTDAHLYKIIHGHITSVSSIFLSIAKKYKLLTIAHCHNTSYGMDFLAIPKNIIQFFNRYIADCFFACSSQAGEWLIGKNSSKKAKLIIIKNAIDTDKFKYDESLRTATRQSLNLEDKFIIGHIGRFSDQKNHTFIIDIFYNFCLTNPNSVLLLIGDGPLKKSIIDKVERLGISGNVIFHGMSTEIPALLNAMDLFLFPSEYEGLGIVLIEAQSCGLPCVISDVIPREAILTDLVSTLSLKDSIQAWIDVITSSTVSNRSNYNLKVRSSGYDIFDTTTYLQNFYCNFDEVKY